MISERDSVLTLSLLRRSLHRTLIEYRIQIKDHACLRILWNNLSCVDPSAKCFRSGHPSRILLKNMRDRGVRHVLSLRGGENLAHNERERYLCEKLGLTYINIPMSSCKPPSKDTLIALSKTFEEINQPLLIHCKTGADRTGLAIGIYSLCKQRNDANKAVEHLSIKYLHFGIGNKSILKKFFKFYSEDNHKSLKFKDWAKSQYSTKKFEEYLFNTNTRKKLLKRSPAKYP